MYEFFEKRGVLPELRDARPYIRYEKGEVAKAREAFARRQGSMNGNRLAHPVRSLGSSSALRMSASSVRPI